ncbi:MAG: CdaR family protein [Anaerolineales bacterium]|nr:CdaR family protein [Anaerolineales bacterium]
MFARLFRWLTRNLAPLLTAFILAVVVWVSAVVAADPNEELLYPKPVALEVIGQDANFVTANQVPSTVRVTIKAPRSIWAKLNTDPDLVRAWVDLSGLKAGSYTLPVKVQVGLTPHQVTRSEPAELKLTLEPLQVRDFAVRLELSGEPTLGYRKGVASSMPNRVTVSGPQSRVSQVEAVVARLEISGLSDSVTREVPVIAVSSDDGVVEGVILSPPTVSVRQDIHLLGGYRNVVVKVVTSGQVAEGYWLTNITVTPPNVTVFSSNPEVVNALPGFVETEPVDLTDMNDDVDIRANLDLPVGVTLAGEESVLVRLSIASLEGSLPISLPVEVVGLPPELSASVSPDKVDVLITGPLPILNNLKPGGIRVSLDLSGLGVGTHQVTLSVDLLPGQVSVASILPESVEVKITYAQTPRPGTATQPAITPSPTPLP